MLELESGSDGKGLVSQNALHWRASQDTRYVRHVGGHRGHMSPSKSDHDIAVIAMSTLVMNRRNSMLGSWSHEMSLYVGIF